MRPLDLISHPRMNKGRTHSLRALLASCVFHGLAFGSLAALPFIYRSHLPPPKSGSAPGAPSLSLETMVIVSPPQPPAPQPPEPKPMVDTAPAIPTPAPIVAATPPPREPEAKPATPEGAVPVLAIQPSKPVHAAPAKSRAAIYPAISPAAVATAQSPSKPASAAATSSYAPGPNVLPHPPYPTEAQDRGQTGTVVMNVQFDAKGDVADAEVAQSSGVPILDSATRSFIRAHWHSPAYAGQAVSVAVRYQSEKHPPASP